MNLLADIRCGDVVNRKHLKRGPGRCLHRGSTNAGLHLPAIAHEAGIDFDLLDVCEIFKDTPYFVNLKPGGDYVAKDLFEAGGVPVVLNELRKVGLIHEDCIVATGRTMGEELDMVQGETDAQGDP